MERIKLDYHLVKEQIPLHKNQSELAKFLGCGTDKLRQFLNETDLHQYYCDIHKVPYKSMENLKCCICGEIKNIHKFKDKPYCKKHYNHMYRYGHVVDKTIYDKNDYIFENDITKIVLRDKYQKIVDYCIIDSEDYEKVKEYKWYLSDGYCITKGIDKNSGVDIYCVIFKNRQPYDHIDNDRLNDRKSNLRLATQQENAMNMSKKFTNTSGVVGVQKQNLKSLRWIASLTYKYKSIWLGSYENFDDAVIARLKGQAKYFKEFSNNYIPNKKLICLEYLSQSDFKTHYVEMNLDGEIITNELRSKLVNDVA